MFKQCDRETVYLFPPSVQEWLPEGHLARFVVEIVDQFLDYFLLLPKQFCIPLNLCLTFLDLPGEKQCFW